ncbi:MAG: sugar-binding transcriptional regulator [Alphaproteobacteria bacterium]
MAKGKKTRGQGGAEFVRGTGHADRLRIRVAWMYYVEQMTQSQIAEILDIGRVTVVRLLADARARNEVKISIEAKFSDAIELERGLERQFGLKRAVIAPVSTPDVDPVPAISAATGDFISDMVTSDMRIGVGWGKTLNSSLPFIRGQTLSNFHVVSLLGGIMAAGRFNPAEFAWRFAEIFQGEGFLFPAPAIVDSPETRRSLIEKCGLNDILEMTNKLDAVLLSVGGATEKSTPWLVGYLNAEQRKSLAKAGAVGDLLFHFFDKAGHIVEHELNNRVMSAAIEPLRKVPIRVMASGGHDKVDALIGAMKLVQPTILITDEFTAANILAKVSEKS